VTDSRNCGKQSCTPEKGWIRLACIQLNLALKRHGGLIVCLCGTQQTLTVWLQAINMDCMLQEHRKSGLIRWLAVQQGRRTCLKLKRDAVYCSFLLSKIEAPAADGGLWGRGVHLHSECIRHIFAR